MLIATFIFPSADLNAIKIIISTYLSNVNPFYLILHAGHTCLSYIVCTSNLYVKFQFWAFSHTIKISLIFDSNHEQLFTKSRLSLKYQYMKYTSI